MRFLFIGLICLAIPLTAGILLELPTEFESSSVASVTMAEASGQKSFLRPNRPSENPAETPARVELRELLFSEPVIERACRQVLDDGAAVSTDDLSAKIRDGLTLAEGGVHGITRISVEMQGDVLAVDVLRALVEDHDVTGIRKDTEARRNEYDLEGAKRKLKEAEDELEQFEREHALTDRKAQQKHLLELSASLYAKLVDLKQKHEGAKAELQVLNWELTNQPEEVLQSRTIRANRTYIEGLMKLFDLEMERDRIRGKYVQNSPWRRRIDAQIRALRSRIAEIAKDEVSSQTHVRNKTRDGLMSRKLEARVVSAVSEAMIGVVEGEQGVLWARALELNRLASQHDRLMRRRQQAVAHVAVAREGENRQSWAKASLPPFALVGSIEAGVISRGLARGLLDLVPLATVILVGVAILLLACRMVRGGDVEKREENRTEQSPASTWTATSEPLEGFCDYGDDTGSLKVLRSTTSSPRSAAVRASPKRARGGIVRDFYYVLFNKEMGARN